jgi:hypothetical protein
MSVLTDRFSAFSWNCSFVGMERDGVLAGTNWNGDLAGCEIAPAELRDQLLDAMGLDRSRQYAERLRTGLRQQGK